MGLFSSLFGGSTTVKMPSDPTLEGYAGGLYNFDPGMGPAGKAARKTQKRIDSGEDVSNLGYFNTIRQKEAADLEGVNQNYMTGANALIAGTGGEQAVLQNRLRDEAQERVRQNAGMDMTQGLADLRGQTANQLQQAFQFRRGSQLQGMQAGTQARLGYYQNRYRLGQTTGIIPALGQAAAGAGSLMAGV